MNISYSGVAEKLKIDLEKASEEYPLKIRKGLVEAVITMRDRARNELASHSGGMENLKNGIRVSHVKVTGESSYSMVIHGLGKRLNRKDYISEAHMRANPDYITFVTRFFLTGTNNREVKTRTITIGGYREGRKWIPERKVKIRLSKPANRGRVQGYDSIRKALDEALLVERINNSINNK